MRGTAGSNNASVIAVIAGMFAMNGAARTVVRTNSGSMHRKRILEISRANSAGSACVPRRRCARHHAPRPVRTRPPHAGERRTRPPVRRPRAGSRGAQPAASRWCDRRQCRRIASSRVLCACQGPPRVEAFGLDAPRRSRRRLLQDLLVDLPVGRGKRRRIAARSRSHRWCCSIYAVASAYMNSTASRQAGDKNSRTCVCIAPSCIMAPVPIEEGSEVLGTRGQHIAVSDGARTVGAGLQRDVAELAGLPLANEVVTKQRHLSVLPDAQLEPSSGAGRLDMRRSGLAASARSC